MFEVIKAMSEEFHHLGHERLQTFLRPSSIALVGATDNSRWSVATYENLKRFEFPGPIYMVNPNREIVHGHRAFKSVSELPQPADLVFVMVTTQRVLGVVQEAAAMGSKNFVILTAGFSEVGQEGIRLEQELLTFANAHQLVLLGPNGNGFINITDHITPYGLRIVPPLTPGPVGVVLQSGALASAVMTFAQAHAIGLSLLVSMGNEAMLSVTDIVDYLLDDEATKVVALFLESIRQPQELRRLAAKARARHKPIVVLKIGRSEISARTAFAHTGALVGNDEINDAVFGQLGIIRVHSLEDLLITAGLAGYCGALPGRRLGVVTPSGGACDILSDLAQQENIVLPDFAPETIQALEAILPPFSTAHNPLDVTGYVVIDGTLQMRALDIVGRDPNLDFILYLTSIEAVRELDTAAQDLIFEQYKVLANTIRAASLPVVLVSNTALDLTPAAQTVVERTGLHFVAGMAHGIRALGRLLWWSAQQRASSSQVEAETVPPPQVTAEPHRGNWSEARARTLLQTADIPVVPGLLAKSEDEAVEAAQSLGFPVVLKIQSADILHKSDVGGVALNLDTGEAVSQSYQKMLKQVQTAQLQATIEGVLVSPMRKGGTELLVGIVRDAVWGLVLTVGLGGIWTEALKDTSVRVLPVTQAEIETMLGELRGAVLLKGGRGQTAVDLQTLSGVIHRLSLLALELGSQLNALEVNPLLVSAAGIEVLDVLVSWEA